MNIEPLLQDNVGPVYATPTPQQIVVVFGPPSERARVLVDRFIEARVGIVNWYRRLMSEAHVKKQRSKPPLSVSLRLSSSNYVDKDTDAADRAQESVRCLPPPPNV
jgi:hypothetical protein